MRVLAADKLSDAFTTTVADLGLELDYDAGLKDAALVARLSAFNPSVLVVRSTKVPAEAIDAARDLELIVRAGAGVDNIDVTHASRRGVFVCNCPGKNAIAVAELTMGLILALDRNIPDNVIEARAGNWDKARFARAAGLKGRTLGLVGLGSIGREVARMGRSLGMRAVAWSRSLTPESAAECGCDYRSDPAGVAADADIVSVHVASTPETQQLIDRSFFEAMKEGALFVNTSRSSVVDEEALVWAIEEKGVRAGLDVFEGEPSVKQGALTTALPRRPEVYATHHIGASTEQAQEAIAAEALRVVATYAATGQAENCVNMATQTPATHQITVRHLDRVGVLAGVLDQMRTAGWNVQEMENLVFDGAEAACARIRFDGTVNAETVARIGDLSDVLAVTLVDI